MADRRLGECSTFVEGKESDYALRREDAGVGKVMNSTEKFRKGKEEEYKERNSK